MPITSGMTVVFQVAAGPRLGFGHLVRCRSLARALGVTPRVWVRGSAATRAAAGALGCEVLPGSLSLAAVAPAVLVVDDMASAVDWYTNVMGMDLVYDAPVEKGLVDRVLGIEGTDITVRMGYFYGSYANGQSTLIEILDYSEPGVSMTEQGGSVPGNGGIFTQAFETKDLDKLLARCEAFGYKTASERTTVTLESVGEIDTVLVSGNYGCSVIDNFARPRADFDGDGRSDVSVFRPADGNWYLNRSQQGFTAVNFGLASDIPTPGDFDGDGKADIAVWRPSTGVWYRLNSSNGQFFAYTYGSSGDIPQAGDFDGDGKDDLALWRPSTGVWYWIASSNGTSNAYQFGLPDDKPVAGDYDGDHKDDIAVWRPSTGVWYRLNSGNGQFFIMAFGLSDDLATPADYDGDGKQDIAVFRPSSGVWYRLNSSNGQFAALAFGLSGDVPAPGDFDGDGKDDQAVYRSGTWYMNQSSSGVTAIAFGLAQDTPVLRAYLP